jgi:hypothetical protein
MQRSDWSGSPISALMAAEHTRLDDLLVQAAGRDGAIDVKAYEDFRRGLLRHIAIEEKVLLPTVQQYRNGEPLALAGRLKQDHGALAALMMLPPRSATFRVTRAVLRAHNPLEDAPGGVYEACDLLVGQGVDEVLARCAAMSAVPVSPWIDSPKVLASVRRVLMRAGYDGKLLDPAYEDLGEW